MNTLSIKVVNPSANNSFINIDGKPVKMKRGENGTGIITYQTENSSVHLSVKTFMEIKGKFWWLTSILYFIVSIFGLFDVRSNRKCRAITYEAELTLTNGDNCTMRLMRWKKGEPAVTLTDIEKDEKENLCFIDEVALRRKKIMLFVKLALTVVLLTTLGFILF